LFVVQRNVRRSRREKGTANFCCIWTKRHSATLLEIDPACCDVIVQRWQEKTGHAAVLDGEDRMFADVTVARAINRS
jgi:hypothetical protein